MGRLDQSVHDSENGEDARGICESLDLSLQISGQSATMVNGPPEIGKSSLPPRRQMHAFYVRIGALAELHLARGSQPLERGRRVIVRTSRGVEVGEVAAPHHPRAAQDSSKPGQPTARILRPTTDQDELLIRRLDRYKREAVEACRTALAGAGSKSTLLDVDQLFDGGTLVMHFLGPVDTIASSITKNVVDRYESVVRSGHFAKLLRDGCGPDCGTDAGGGCGTRCEGCLVASSCHQASGRFPGETT